MKIPEFMLKMMPTADSVKKFFDVAVATSFAALSSCVDVAACFGVAESYELAAHDFNSDGTNEYSVTVDGIKLEVCFSDLSFEFPVAALNTLFGKIVENNFFVKYFKQLGAKIESYLGAGKAAVGKTIAAVKNILTSLMGKVSSVSGNLLSAKQTLENALSALGPNALSFLPDVSSAQISKVMKSLAPNFGGRRLTAQETDDLTEFLLQRRTLKQFQDLSEEDRNKLHEEVVREDPHNHKRMLATFDGSWLKQVFDQIPSMRMKFGVRAGWTLNTAATVAFSAEGDIMDIEAVKKKIGNLLPFEKEVEVPLFFPGLYAKMNVNVDIRMPWSMHAEAGGNAALAFDYDKEFEVVMSKADTSASELQGGVASWTPTYGADAQVHGAVGLRLNRLDASAQLCFFSACGGLFLQTSMDLFKAGFDAWASSDTVPTGAALTNEFTGYAYRAPTGGEIAEAGKFFAGAHFLVYKPLVHVYTAVSLQLMCLADVNKEITLFKTNWGDGDGRFFLTKQFTKSAGSSPPTAGGTKFDASAPKADMTLESNWYEPKSGAFCPQPNVCKAKAIAQCFNMYCGADGEFTGTAQQRTACTAENVQECRGCFTRSKCGFSKADVAAATATVDHTPTVFDKEQRVTSRSECTIAKIKNCGKFARCFSIGCNKHGSFDAVSTMPECSAANLVTIKACAPCFPHSPCGLDQTSFPALATSSHDDDDAGIKRVNDYCPQALIDAGCKYAGKCFGDSSNNAGCSAADGKTIKATGVYAQCSKVNTGARCAGCFPTSPCTYSPQEVKWLKKVEPASTYCPDVVFDRCLAETWWCFSKGCKANGEMSITGAYEKCSSYVGTSSMCSECFRDSPCGSHFAVEKGSSGTWSKNPEITPTTACPASMAKQCRDAEDCFNEGCGADGKTVNTVGKWEICKQAAQCFPCFPNSKCKLTDEETKQGTAKETFATDDDGVKEVPAAEGGSCPKTLYEQCKPYGNYCYGKACSATEFEPDTLITEGAWATQHGAYSLAKPHYPFKPDKGFHYLAWGTGRNGGVYAGCAGLPEACRACFPDSPCGGDPFEAVESAYVCPQALLDVGCGKAGRYFFEGCDAATGQHKTSLPWGGPDYKYAHICGGCFPKSACAFSAEVKAAGKPVGLGVGSVCPDSILKADTDLACETLGACFAVMTMPRYKITQGYPDIALFDTCRRKSIACVGCFPKASTAIPAGAAGDAYRPKNKGNDGLVGPVYNPVTKTLAPAVDNTFCWDVPKEEKKDRCTDKTKLNKADCNNVGAEWKTAKFSLFDHCKFAGKCVIEGCDENGVWNTDKNSVFAPCEQAPICTGCFPTAKDKCKIKEADKAELVSLWGSIADPDACAADSQCGMYAPCMTLACPADGQNWEAQMVGPYAGCKDLLPTSETIFESGPLGNWKTSGGVIQIKRRVCASCWPKSPCSPKTCYDNFHGAEPWTSAKDFPGHPGRISCIKKGVGANVDWTKFPGSCEGKPEFDRDMKGCEKASNTAPNAEESAKIKFVSNMQCYPFGYKYDHPDPNYEKNEKAAGRSGKTDCSMFTSYAVCDKLTEDPNHTGKKNKDIPSRNGKTAAEVCCMCGGGSRPTVGGMKHHSMEAAKDFVSKGARRLLNARRRLGLIDIPKAWKPPINLIAGAVMDPIKEIGKKVNDISKQVNEGLKNAADSFKIFGKAVIDKAVTPMTNQLTSLGNVGDFISKTANTVNDIKGMDATSPIDLMKKAADAAINKIGDAFRGKVTEMFEDIVKKGAGGAANFLKEMRDKILKDIISLDAEKGLCVKIDKCLVGVLNLPVYDVPLFGKVDISNFVGPEFCIAGFDFDMDLGCIGGWFVNLLTGNEFISTMMSMAKEIIKGLWKATGISESMLKILAKPAKIAEDAKKVFENVKNSVTDQLSNIKAKLLSLIGGRRLSELGEHEQHIVHLHRILQNDDHKDRFAMIMGIQALNDAATDVYPEHFNPSHRRQLGRPMRRLLEQSSMNKLMKCFTGIQLTYNVDWGYDLVLESKKTFAIERDLMSLPQVKKLVKGMLPFSKQVQVPLYFPGLYLTFDTKIEVQAPVAAQVSAGGSTTVKFRYAEVLDINIAATGVTVTTTNARPSVDVLKPSAALAFSGYAGFKLSRVDASMGLCFQNFCAHLHAKTSTNLLNVGFDLQTRSQADLAKAVKMVNPLYPTFQSYDFKDCAGLIGAGKPDVLAMGVFFTIDKPKVTVSYELPKLTGAASCLGQLPGGILFQALWENDPHIYQASKVKCTAVAGFDALKVDDAFTKTDINSLIPSLKSKAEMVLTFPNGLTAGGEVKEADKTLIKTALKVTYKGASKIVFSNLKVTRKRRSQRRVLMADEYTVVTDFAVSFLGMASLKLAQALVKREPIEQAVAIAAALKAGGGFGADPTIASIADDGLASASGEALIVQAAAPENCVGGWLAWGTCSQNCAGGKRSRVYAITTPKSGAGTACSNADQDVDTEVSLKQAVTTTSF